jgi:hypothetical protein
LTKREDTPFWKEIKYSMKVPDSLAEYLVKCRLALPNGPSGNILFQESSWACVLIGMNFLPGPAAYMNLDPQEVTKQRSYIQRMRMLRTELEHDALSHNAYLKQLGSAA